VYAVDVELTDAGPSPGRVSQVTSFASGAAYPDASPDGRTLAYVGYTTAGYDVFLLPLDRAAWQPVSAFSPPDVGTPDPPDVLGDARPPGPLLSDPAILAPGQPQRPVPSRYKPWSTLLPRSWLPAWDTTDQQVKIGAQASGGDVLGRHVWAASVVARVAGEPSAPGSPRYDWAATYAYDRWRPTFWLGASDRTHYVGDVFVGSDVLATADIREQDCEAGVTVTGDHLRWTQSWSASFDVARRTLRVGEAAAARDRNGVRASWQVSNAKLYAGSISPEQGIRSGVAAEIVRSAFGADGNAAAVMADVRGYMRLFGRHRILASRLGVGASGGTGPARQFYLGGPGPSTGPVDFSSDALSLLRGREREYAYRGTHVLIGSLEYRVPLWRAQGGIGTLPVFLRSLHAAAFLDVGKAWDQDFAQRGFARGAGFELGADLRLAYEWPLTLMAGIAWPHDPFRPRAKLPPVAYVRFGRAF